MRVAKPAQIDLASLISTAEAASLTRSEIARRAGLSRQTVSAIALGDRGTRPSAKTFLALQRVVDSIVPALSPIVDK